MIPDVTADAITSAMTRFDAEMRDTTSWVHWQSNRRHRFAINANGKFYPVKQIDSMATNTPVSAFGGGTEAN